MNYYIQGDAANADKIKAAFEKLGCDTTGWKFNVEGGFYYTHDGRIDLACGNFLINLIKTHPDYKELELPVEPKFKVGDSLQSGSHFTKILSINLEEGRYYCDNRIISFKNQDLWHLAPKPHYDISNFKPFQKVLVRQDDSCTWGASFFGRYAGMFMCCNNACFIQCIPFNDDTKHLLGTTDMCDEQYINW